MAELVTFPLTLTICRGLPASGKSTWATEQVRAYSNMVRVNRDDLRGMLFDNDNPQMKWTSQREKSAVQARNVLIAANLQAGRHVICDDTNLDPKVVAELTAIAEANNAAVVFKDFTHVEPKECIKRDLNRSRSVGKDVIMGMYNKFLRPKPDPTLQNPELPPCIIVDMDGTLANLGDRSPYDDAACEVDTLNEPVWRTVQRLTSDMDRKVTFIVMSGRDEGRSREATTRWLAKHDIYPDFIHMRPASDTRHDSIVKKELYMAHIAGKYFVDLVLDDRDQVVDLWRLELGLPCMQVNYGAF